MTLKAFVKSGNGVLIHDTIWCFIIPNVILAFLTALTHCLDGIKSFDTILPKSGSSVNLHRSYYNHNMHCYVLYGALYISSHLKPFAYLWTVDISCLYLAEVYQYPLLSGSICKLYNNLQTSEYDWKLLYQCHLQKKEYRSKDRALGQAR